MKSPAENTKFEIENWKEEISSSITESNTLCIALFNPDGELLYANNAIRLLFKGDNPAESILNPPFRTFSENQCRDCCVYHGYITFGNFSSVNTSIMARVYSKNNKIMIIGGVDSEQLLSQNLIMHNLNREIGNLQRQLIKEKRTLEETLIKLNSTVKELNEANATKDKFFSIIAHDLKNPFTTIIGFSEYLKSNLREMELSEIEEIIEMMNTSGHTTYKLLEDILMWSRSHLGKMPFSPECTSLADLWEEVSGPLILSAENKEITLNFYGGNTPSLFCDKNMVKTVIRNLVSNAVKFSYRGGSVNITAEVGKKFATISISDKGVGIAPEMLEKIWVVGSHHSSSGTESESGTGLGLVICKEFVQAHGGTIWAESKPGEGSSFNFTIPLDCSS